MIKLMNDVGAPDRHDEMIFVIAKLGYDDAQLEQASKVISENPAISLEDLKVTLGEPHSVNVGNSGRFVPTDAIKRMKVG